MQRVGVKHNFKEKRFDVIALDFPHLARFREMWEATALYLKPSRPGLRD
jgi:hypothetical protein